MANVIKLKSGDSGDNPASDSLVRGEVAIRHVAGDHTASSSSKLYFGEAQGSGSVTLRQFGFGIAGDSGQHGIAIGENFTITGGNALTTVVSGDAVTINHDDTSSQASSNNSGQTFIQDITLDTYGHVTGIGTATASGSSGIALTDLSVGSEGSASGDGGIAYNNSSGEFTYTPPVHDSLSGFVSNEHIDHSGVSVTAGDGLTGGGTIASTRTLNVVGGDGITANANDIAVTAANTNLTSIINDDFTKLGRSASQEYITFATDNQINTFINNTERLSVTASGVDITGNLTISGNNDYSDLVAGDVPTLNQNTTGTAAIATTVTLTDESSDTTCFPVFSQHATGNRALETGSNLTFNSSTGTLGATDFSGKLTMGTHTVDDIDIDSEFVDSDEHLMTSKAINNRIQDFFVDEDNMSSNSASLVPTQQSVKTYVDNEVAAAGGGGTGNISFSGTTMAGNAMTLDSAGEIALSADDNGEVKFFDGDAHYATMQKDSTQGLKLTAGSDEVAILTTTDTGKLKSTGHTWIQAHHFGISNLDNNTAVYLSWVSSNSNQGNIPNHRPLMPCAGRILKCMITARGANSPYNLAAMSTASSFFELALTGSSTYADVGFGGGNLTFTDLGRDFSDTGNYPITIAELNDYTWGAGDTIVGTLTNKGGSSNVRASMTMLVEWQV